jgi:predicted nucleotidyltransferase
MRSVIQRRSCGSAQIFWLDRDLLRRRLGEATGRLVGGCPEVCKVVLFGSAAEGREVASSDVDLLLVLDKSAERFIDRPLRYWPYFNDVGLAVDVFAYTRAEIKLGDIPLVRDALVRGIPLYER